VRPAGKLTKSIVFVYENYILLLSGSIIGTLINIFQIQATLLQLLSNGCLIVIFFLLQGMLLFFSKGNGKRFVVIFIRRRILKKYKQLQIPRRLKPFQT
jgi:hypothetical protein